MALKVTIVGGGSSMFVPLLLRRFLAAPCMRGGTLALMDVDAGRLAVMDSLARALVENEGADLTIESTTDQRESLVGADFVIISIAVGGMASWEDDIEIPGRHGVFMHIADSIGPGGIMRAFRNLPVIESIARDTRRGRARTPGSSTTRTPRRRSRTCCATSRASASSRSARAPDTRRTRNGSRSRRASRPDELMTPVPVARAEPLRRRHRTASARRNRRAAARARADAGRGRALGARQLRDAALLLGALGRVLPAAAASGRPLRAAARRGSR